MNARSTLAVLAASLFAVAAAAQTAEIPGSDDPTEFSLRLYKEVAKGKPGENVLISPYSARESVGLAYAGSRGDTRAALAKTLFAGRVADFVESSKKTRRTLMEPDPKATLKVANSLWLRDDWKFLDSYKALARDGFGAEVFRRPFSPATVGEVNAWVSGKTDGKIRSIIEKLGPTDVAVLLNAVYFKGIWRTPFDKKKTAPRDFHLASGETVQRERMTLSAPKPFEERKFEYAEDADLQAVSLPYGSGNVSMIVLLPAPGKTLEDLIQKLDGSRWRGLRGAMRSREGDVELPRFKFSAEALLNEPLEAMGAKSAFDPARSDFRGMAEARKASEMLRISRTVQEATIEVDEDGTVAAAATGVTMTAGAGLNQEPPFRFVADRPFLFALENAETGTLLFVGSVQDPR